MKSYNPLYRKYINQKKAVIANRMSRAKFYQIKDYEYVDGTRGVYSDQEAPIIYTLFVSKSKDIVHAVKVSLVNPTLIKRFFGKFVNESTHLIEMRGGSKKFYESVVSKVPIVSNEAYRTYKLSGFSKVYELDMDVNKLTPVFKDVVGIDPKSQKKNI